MVKFLIHKPIAVIMTFIAIITLGLITYNLLPVSLMPDVDSRKITIYLQQNNLSLHTLEENFTSIIREKLIQTSHLDDLNSITKDGKAEVLLTFDYDANMNLALLEVNDAIDELMTNLPKDFNRPIVIKENLSDIPVFYINVYSKDVDFSTLSMYVDNVLRRRLEQLQEVAMVDITGKVNTEIIIVPNMEKLSSLKISTNDFIQTVLKSNYSLGTITVKDGNYLYTLTSSKNIVDVKELEKIYIKSGERILKIGELCTIKINNQKSKGYFLLENERSLSLGVIKKSNSKIGDLEKNINEVLEQTKKQHPELVFKYSRNQIKLLDISISNLMQCIYLDCVIAIILMFFFFKNKNALLIGISIPVSLITCLVFFNIFNISINIISLSGLVFAIGLMIDNSIVSIDNMSQRLNNGENLESACSNGTLEIIRPFLSSFFTACAVFFPLVYLGGISGKLFYEEAVVITIGLAVSLVISITLLPTLFYLFNKAKKNQKNLEIGSGQNLSEYIEHLYEKSLNYCFHHKLLFSSFFIILLLLSFVLFIKLKKTTMPELAKTDMILNINWNENININENKIRTQELYKVLEKDVISFNGICGEQDFLLKNIPELDVNESSIYVEFFEEKQYFKTQKSITDWISKYHPNAIYSFSTAGNLFDKLFAGETNDLYVKIYSKENELQLDEINEKISEYNHMHSIKIKPIDTKQMIIINYNIEKLMLYDIDIQEVTTKLNIAFNNFKLYDIKSNNRPIPVMIGSNQNQMYKTLSGVYITNKKEEKNYPIMDFISIKKEIDFKKLLADKKNTYITLLFNESINNVASTEINVKNAFSNNDDENISFDGEYYQSKKNIAKLIFILIVAIFLMYFILAAQFESFTQPLIVLIEIPMGIAGALILLYLSGATINLMSMIGIIVLCGIIMNDSILKVDAINQYLRQGAPLMESIISGGRKRFKAIVMTGMTTILGVLSFLFFDGLGADLQKPLALSVVGGMVIGTFISLYFVPIAYWYIHKNKHEK